MLSLSFVAWVLLAAPAAEDLTQIDPTKASKEELDTAIRSATSEHLLAFLSKRLATLPTYRYVLVKQERIDGELKPVQEISNSIREKPYAVRLQFLKGPKAGRKVIYNEQVKKDEFRVREVGFLGIAGPVWLKLTSSLAFKDTKHGINESGFGKLLARFRSEVDKAEPLGGFKVTQEGWNDPDTFCQLWTAPNNGKGFLAAKTRICFDPRKSLPVLVAGYDPNGTLLERFEFTKFEPVELGPEVFDPSTI